MAEALVSQFPALLAQACPTPLVTTYAHEQIKCTKVHHTLATSLFMESLMGTDTIFEHTNTQHTVGNKYSYAGLFTAQPSLGDQVSQNLNMCILLEVPLPAHG